MVFTLPDLPAAQAVEGREPSLKPIFPGAVAQATRTYDLGTATVTVHVAYFRRQVYGAKMVSADNILFRYDDHVWNRLSAGRVAIDVAGRKVVMRTAELVSGGTGSTSGRKRLDVRQTYWSAGRFTSSDHWAAALGVFGRLAGQGDDGAIITIYTEGEAAATEPRLAAFISSHLGALESQLAGVRNVR